MNTANRVLDELYFITTTVVDWVDGLAGIPSAAERAEDIRMGADEQPSAHNCQCRSGAVCSRPYS